MLEDSFQHTAADIATIKGNAHILDVINQRIRVLKEEKGIPHTKLIKKKKYNPVLF